MNSSKAAPSGSPARPPAVYAIDRWTKETGLPDTKVRTVLQTRDGYLWAGTEAGLARFDGTRFTVFDAANTPALKAASPAVRCLYEDEERRLWVGTSSGLLCRSDGAFTTLAGEDKLAGLRVNAIAPRRSGGIWIGTDRGLASWDGAQVDW